MVRHVERTDEHIRERILLCDICQTLDLEAEKFSALSRDESEDSSSAPRQLGLLSDIRRKTFCPFCRLVCKAADRPLLNKNPNTDPDKQEPTCFMRWLIDGQQQDEAGVNQEQTYQPQTRRIHIYSEPPAFRDAYLVLLANDAISPLFFGRVLPEHQVNFVLLQRWLSICQSWHGSTCDRALTQKIVGAADAVALRVIDVQQQCVIPAPSNCRYMALSYLWGRDVKDHFRATPENMGYLCITGSLTQLKLSRTIADAIVLTANLGERYLWVDSICLVFDGKGNSFEEYHVDAIYANAILTVVAGAGLDYNAGLPGVQPDSRDVQQDIEECGPRLRLMLTHLAEDYIRTSEWNSRGWTFQERLLSKRCLFFFNERIYFQCRQTTFCEDIVGEQESIGCSLDCIGMAARILRGISSLQYISSVQLYTQRQLTLESDILRAFKGVANVLERHMKTNFLHGLPESMLDFALLWHSPHQLRRRPGFPSWSWAGWIGMVQWNASLSQTWIAWYKHYADNRTIFMPQSNTTSSEESSNQTVPVALIPFSPSLTPASPLLHFWTTTAFFSIISQDASSIPIHYHSQRNLIYPSVFPDMQSCTVSTVHDLLGIQDTDGRFCGTVLLDSRSTKPLLEVHEFLILSSGPAFIGERQESSIVYNVLLVEWKDFIAYRAGLGRIRKDALSCSFEPGVSWKEILLG